MLKAYFGCDRKGLNLWKWEATGTMSEEHNAFSLQKNAIQLLMPAVCFAGE
jgi:hypothetical protein